MTLSFLLFLLLSRYDGPRFRWVSSSRLLQQEASSKQQANSSR